jgi:hypothetical protein
MTTSPIQNQIHLGLNKFKFALHTFIIVSLFGLLLILDIPNPIKFGIIIPGIFIKTFMLFKINKPQITITEFGFQDHVQGKFILWDDIMNIRFSSNFLYKSYLIISLKKSLQNSRNHSPIFHKLLLLLNITNAYKLYISTYYLEVDEFELYEILTIRKSEFSSKRVTLYH